jgi:hypothetical protein
MVFPFHLQIYFSSKALSTRDDGDDMLARAVVLPTNTGRIEAFSNHPS